jgi:hypothetical protein
LYITRPLLYQLFQHITGYLPRVHGFAFHTTNPPPPSPEIPTLPIHWLPMLYPSAHLQLVSWESPCAFVTSHLPRRFSEPNLRRASGFYTTGFIVTTTNHHPSRVACSPFRIADILPHQSGGVDRHLSVHSVGFTHSQQVHFSGWDIFLYGRPPSLPTPPYFAPLHPGPSSTCDGLFFMCRSCTHQLSEQLAKLALNLQSGCLKLLVLPRS